MSTFDSKSTILSNISNNDALGKQDRGKTFVDNFDENEVI